jgi:hypothetical protein
MLAPVRHTPVHQLQLLVLADEQIKIFVVYRQLSFWIAQAFVQAVPDFSAQKL